MSMTLYLAPVRGFTDEIFRNIHARYFGGFDLAVAPFIGLARGRKVGRSVFRDVLPENNRSLPVVPQLIGRETEDFLRMAACLADMGYEEINWNLGCPFPMVARKKHGSGMLCHPMMVENFLDDVMPKMPCRLSIKVRIGRYERDEIFELMPVFNNYPLSELIIHPRTGVQMYRGGVDLDAFERCVEMSHHPVVYNGDITDAHTFRCLSGRFKGVDRWMIGRGAIFNPFLPAVLKSGTDVFPAKIDMLKKMHDELFDAYSGILSGPSHIISRMKGWWQYLSLAFENGRKISKKINKIKSLDRYVNVVNEFFESEALWKDELL